MLVRNIPKVNGATIIDVRSREEFDLGHPKGAVHITWDLHLYYLKELQELPTPWLFCCEEGVRSGQVVLSLKMLGFEEVYNIGSWIDVDREFEALPTVPVAGRPAPADLFPA